MLFFRWLVSQGRFSEAVVILRKFEKINKTKVPEGLYAQFEVSIKGVALVINRSVN